MTRIPIFHRVLPLLFCLLAAAAQAQEPEKASRSGKGQVTRTFYLENADVKDVVTILRSVAGIPHPKPTTGGVAKYRWTCS